ncbi:NfeD family protein [Arenibaculum pallidiluteum]|uniref:NfeD family protein n=1 Tax=Arenibaculum pallidiluteum TaxID=2812559 RepID=UPI001F1D1817|nr:NfeD family protein [Arenibaculum pallidiluteum]
MTPWIWAAAGLALLGVEMLVPGLFLVWFGIGAVAAALATSILGGIGLTGEIGVFVLVSGALIGMTIYRQGLRRHDDSARAAEINDRAAQLVGRRATLAEPIVNGRGRVFFGDTLWQVTGPDRPAGTAIRVVGTRDMLLVVQPVDEG